jgi:hypothetical protein
VLKKFNVEFDSLNELQETEDMVQFFKEFNRSVKTGEAINLGRVEEVTGAVQPTATQPTTTQPAAQQTKAIEARRNALPEFQSNTRTSVTQDILDYFAEVEGIPKFTDDINSGGYINWLQSEGGFGEQIMRQLQAPRNAFDLITKRAEERLAKNAPAATQPAAQAAPVTTSQLIAPNTVTPAQPVEQELTPNDVAPATITSGFEDNEQKIKAKEIGTKTISSESVERREGKVTIIGDKELYAKTYMHKNGDVYTGFWIKDEKGQKTSGKYVNFSAKDKKNSIEAFEKGYGISVKDALAQQGVKLNAGEKITEITVWAEKFVNENGKPIRAIKTTIKIGDKYASPTKGRAAFSEFYIGVPKLMYTTENKVPVGG